MTKNEMIVKILEARLKVYKTDLYYTEAVYGKDSLEASKSRGIFCECAIILDMLCGSEEKVSEYYDIWYQ